MKNYSELFEIEFKTKSTQLMDKHVERFGYSWSRHIVALYDSFVSLRPACHIVGFHCKNLLQDVRSTEGLQCPYFHFSETLSAELSLTAKRLLGNQRVRSSILSCLSRKSLAMERPYTKDWRRMAIDYLPFLLPPIF